MKPALHRFGRGEHPVVVVDDFSGTVEHIVDIAAALAPYPRPAKNYYPGLRRIIRDEDEAAMAYVVETLERAAPFIGGAFDLDSFDLVEASFSMVTTLPQSLSAPQRAPHFDALEPDYLALLHYLSDTPGTGTAFFRHRATGVELISEQLAPRFLTLAQREAAMLDGYVRGSNGYFEQIGAVESAPDRLAIYQGALLHSGIIPPDMNFSDDPRRGRLTLNVFLQGRRG